MATPAVELSIRKTDPAGSAFRFRSLRRNHGGLDSKMTLSYSQAFESSFPGVHVSSIAAAHGTDQKTRILNVVVALYQ
jgi:hypothetical protein